MANANFSNAELVQAMEKNTLAIQEQTRVMRELNHNMMKWNMEANKSSPQKVTQRPVTAPFQDQIPTTEEIRDAEETTVTFFSASAPQVCNSAAPARFFSVFSAFLQAVKRCAFLPAAFFGRFSRDLGVFKGF